MLRNSYITEFLELLSSTVEQLIASESRLVSSLLAALTQILSENVQLPTQILDVINQHWTDQVLNKKSLASFLQALVERDIVSPDLAIELVDRSLLQECAIISNAQILGTRSVRINTGLLYKQQKFNLLREENEGYAKLSHEFNIALSELPKGGLADISEIRIKSDELLTVVNALIGYFELDPNRVLDNIFDICSQNLLSHARFILHFLHHSPWAPTTLAAAPPFAFVEEGERRRRLDAIQRDFVQHYKEEMRLPGGSKLAARLLGFKLQFLARAVDTNDRSPTSSESVVFLTALLLKSGFVKLADIYAYVLCLFVRFR